MTMDSAARTAVNERIRYLTGARNTITVDADTHISDPKTVPSWMRERLAANPNYFHGRLTTRDLLIREMDLAGVDLALCWQNPAATEYGTDQKENADRLLAANRYIVAAAKKYPTRIFPAGWTDPAALGLEGALAMVDTCTRELGTAIVKMNPAQNAYAIDSPDVLALVDRIVERGAVPAFHFGADTPYTPVEGLERIVARHPDHPVLGIHFGGGGAGYVESEALSHAAREMGLRHRNVYFIESAKRDAHIEADLITYRLAGSEHWKRIFLASDAPYGRQSWNFGGYRLMFETLRRGGDGTDPRHMESASLFDDEIIQDFMGRNFADFAVAACKRLLDVN